MCQFECIMKMCFQLKESKQHRNAHPYYPYSVHVHPCTSTHSQHFKNFPTRLWQQLERTDSFSPKFSILQKQEISNSFRTWSSWQEWSHHWKKPWTSNKVLQDPRIFYLIRNIRKKKILICCHYGPKLN